MSIINQIAKGFYNSLKNKEQDLFRDRIKICRKCKLYRKDKMLGEVCNSRLYLNPETDETSTVKREGFGKGCGCILSAKCRVKEAKCPIRKW